MQGQIVEQVVDFYGSLFSHIFADPFRTHIAEPLKRKAVVRQIEEAADAASQSLTRFFLNEQLTELQVALALQGFGGLPGVVALKDIANPNVAPETLVESLLPKLPCPEALQKAGLDAAYRVALHSVVQVLMLVGPVMAEWQKLTFSTTFELPRRVVSRLNQISDQLGALGKSGEAAADERFELQYRDYLLQRFHRVEAGTVRMTTNLDVDLRELFVMPQVLVRSASRGGETEEGKDAQELMNLAAARAFFGGDDDLRAHEGPEEHKSQLIAALEQVKKYPRNVLIGAPGGGKSTFFEWLQLKLANAEEVLVLGDQQAIPLLLRVRQLDVKNLPSGAELIEHATLSKDRATLMPWGWIDRQMGNGRVLFMLDGLDETEPELRDRFLIPWLLEMCRRYPQCRYLVSSRPVGYPAGTLRSLEFAECDLADFEEPQIKEYTRHWCTAVRLARNEIEEEARREGVRDGESIVSGFGGHPYIRNLARNPLMLSAICLVNYFEGGELPKDRAVLYKLCVEGLLHHWDQRRGIRSEFTFDEKLRACREVALAMQADDRAEYESAKVASVFEQVLGGRAAKLLEHVRYRTGLLLERRPGIFAFAHLTFQEYLAARAVLEGSLLSIAIDRLIRDHNDGRWKEVIALYCGMAPSPSARQVIEQLIACEDTESITSVLGEAYFAARPDLAQDSGLRCKVLQRVARAPNVGGRILDLFPADEVTPVANACVGTILEPYVTESHRWLLGHPELIEVQTLAHRLHNWPRLNPFQTGELIHLAHACLPDRVLAQVCDKRLYAANGPAFRREGYGSQAEVALLGLVNRRGQRPQDKAARVFSEEFDAALLNILEALSESPRLGPTVGNSLRELIPARRGAAAPKTSSACRRFALASRKLAAKLTALQQQRFQTSIDALGAWADSLERVMGKESRRPAGIEQSKRSKGKRRT